MKKIILLYWVLTMLLFTLFSCSKENDNLCANSEDRVIVPSAIVSIQDYGVLPENSPEKNKANLQKAIDECSKNGAALYVTPVSGGYRISSGIVLKKNVSLIGAHGPTGRGTVDPSTNSPVGSLFIITDDRNPFLSVMSATRVSGIQFYYPEQTYNDPSKIIKYPPTIQMFKGSQVQGVTLTDLTFYGEYMAMDFRSEEKICEQILFENCYGYPLGGEFIAIDKCYDIPRILHCHVNPANMREFGRSFSKSVIDAVVSNKKYTYSIDHTDNAQLIDVFTFGNYGGIYLGGETYGQLTNFNLDCVTIGIYKAGNNYNNRNWQISQGSIIANVGKSVEEIHPFYITGKGHTAITNVECFSGDNPALTNVGASYDYITVDGEGKSTVVLVNCCMSGYVAESPITINNKEAKVSCVACVDKNEKIFDLTI